MRADRHGDPGRRPGQREPAAPTAGPTAQAGTAEGTKGKKGKKKPQRGDVPAGAGAGRAHRSVHRLRHRRHAGDHICRRRLGHPDHAQPAHRSSPRPAPGRRRRETLTVTITSGDDYIWSSRECPASIPPQDVVVRAGRRRPGRGHLVGASAPTRPAPTSPSGRSRASTTSRRPPSVVRRPTSSSSWSPRARAWSPRPPSPSSRAAARARRHPHTRRGRRGQLRRLSRPRRADGRAERRLAVGRVPTRGWRLRCSAR